MQTLPFKLTQSLRTGQALHRLLARMWQMHLVSGERRALARLSPEQLHDIGLDAEAVQQELRRPLWDVPRHWRR